MFGFPAGPEWIIIFVVALLVFGKKLPEVARNAGQMMAQFRKGLDEFKHDVDSHVAPLRDEMDSVHREVKQSIDAGVNAASEPPPQQALASSTPLQLPTAEAAAALAAETARVTVPASHHPKMDGVTPLTLATETHDAASVASHDA